MRISGKIFRRFYMVKRSREWPRDLDLPPFITFCVYYVFYLAKERQNTRWKNVEF